MPNISINLWQIFKPPLSFIKITTMADLLSYHLLFILVPLLGLLMLAFWRWRKQALRNFVQSEFRGNFIKHSRFGSKTRVFLYFSALIALILAIVDLVGVGQKQSTKQAYTNIVVAVDVSNSMNCQDVSPSRLQQAKATITECLQQMPDQKMGLMIFAGDAVSVMPITNDFGAVENFMNSVESQMIKRQGTDFYQAVEVAVEMLKNQPKSARQMLILSDGEDHENRLSEAVDLAKKHHIQITCLGFGTKEGGPVPEFFDGQLMGYKRDMNGEMVVSRQQTEALVSLANACDGIYLDGNTPRAAAANVANYYDKKRQNLSVEYDSQAQAHYYQYFLALALLLYFIIFLTNPKGDFNI
jgi:Ca-activated chloride channel homolog